MSQQRLLQLAPPPAAPVKTGNSNDWDAVEQNLGSKFPRDYKWFIGTYGGCAFFDFLQVLSPFGERISLIERHRQRAEAIGALQEQFPVFPKEGGLLLCAGDENGNSLFWMTKGAPDSWELVYYADDYLEFVHYPIGLVEFLAGFVAGEYSPHFITGVPFRNRGEPIVTSCSA